MHWDDIVGGAAVTAAAIGGTNVSGTKCGVRLDIGGNIGLVGHWYDGVVADGTLLQIKLKFYYNHQCKLCLLIMANNKIKIYIHQIIINLIWVIA